jgi:hypothetical protein
MARKQAMTPDDIEVERSALRVEQQDITAAGDMLRSVRRCGCTDSSPPAVGKPPYSIAQPDHDESSRARGVPGCGIARSHSRQSVVSLIAILLQREP